MADKPTVQIASGKTPEEIAYALFLHVVAVEGKKLDRQSYGGGEHPAEKIADRDFILDTFEECLLAVKGLRAKRNRAVSGTSYHG